MSAMSSMNQGQSSGQINQFFHQNLSQQKEMSRGWQCLAIIKSKPSQTCRMGRLLKQENQTVQRSDATLVVFVVQVTKTLKWSRTAVTIIFPIGIAHNLYRNIVQQCSKCLVTCTTAAQLARLSRHVTQCHQTVQHPLCFKENCKMCNHNNSKRSTLSFQYRKLL